ncbi:aspartyl/glutamyl-tRNA amidotransferase subunit B [Streptomyces sviceus ATCC 29083]|uniref:Aspartyl/glutamyl-tRNA amidotransferase subunit B n=1 Tax=Streptomyces sviceus (strain ATCC 29083 / DSM 924 / JCM 4929 / NBRC 13980 / NCIMB 11184 / NRRL 5439 / UC 5370) TaxID=463191 RepID=B5HUN8_STRX2|nr:aspartyl/glutamyl-tRNA amidotransferase subunit B [Streptomyces sviceus ATCC 29083]
MPLLPTPDLPDGSYPFPWIEDVEDFLSGLEDQGDVEVFDEGEEDGDLYVFFVTGAGERDLLAVASRVATLPGVPAGAVAVLSNDEAEEFGLGRRVVLPLHVLAGSDSVGLGTQIRPVTQDMDHLVGRHGGPGGLQ